MSALRVGFVLCSSVSKPIPSTRIAVLNMLPFLAASDIEAGILFEPDEPCETPDLTGVAKRAIDAACNVVVLQKVRGPSAEALARQLAIAGIRTVYSVCDLIEAPMVESTDATAVVTEYLRSLYPAELQSRMHVVHDGIERPVIEKNEWGINIGTRLNPLKAVLVTSASLDHLPVINQPPPWLRIRIVGRYARGLHRWKEIRWTLAKEVPEERLDYLRFLANRRIACLPWDQEGVYDEMMQADLAVIPIDRPNVPVDLAAPPSWRLKSENRLTMKMSMGLPVIATPIPSYEAVIEDGVNGFFASSRRDWERCLTALREPARRQEMGLAARHSVTSNYSMEKQATKLIQLLRKVGS